MIKFIVNIIVFVLLLLSFLIEGMVNSEFGFFSSLLMALIGTFQFVQAVVLIARNSKDRRLLIGYIILSVLAVHWMATSNLDFDDVAWPASDDLWCTRVVPGLLSVFFMVLFTRSRKPSV